MIITSTAVIAFAACEQQHRPPHRESRPERFSFFGGGVERGRSTTSAIVKDNVDVVLCQPPLAVANALTRHARRGPRSLHKKFGTGSAAVHGA